MFPGSEHSEKYVLDTWLTYKIHKFKQGKTMKTKKVVNPNIMFTAFTSFSDNSPGQVRKDMVEWIESNLELFKQQCFMAMAVRDIDFDTWFNQIKSNDFIGDEFCLSALCQMYQRHALVITAKKVWTTIPSNFGKTDDEIRRICDIHLLYMCRDTFALLKPVFEWKREVPLGEISLLTPAPQVPLGDTTETQLAKEDNEQNLSEIKQEQNIAIPTATNVQDQLGLVDVPALPEVDHPLPDATTNLLVRIPGIEDEPMDATETVTVPTHDEEGELMDTTTDPRAKVRDKSVPTATHKIKTSNLATSVPCSIVLKDVSDTLRGKQSVRIPHTMDEIRNVHVCATRIDQDVPIVPRK